MSILYFLFRLSRRRATVPTRIITPFCWADQNSSDSQASQRHLQLSNEAPLTVSQFSKCKCALSNTAGPVHYPQHLHIPTQLISPAVDTCGTVHSADEAKLTLFADTQVQRKAKLHSERLRPIWPMDQTHFLVV